MKLLESKFTLAFLVKIPVSRLAFPQIPEPNRRKEQKKPSLSFFSISEKSDGPVAYGVSLVHFSPPETLTWAPFDVLHRLEESRPLRFGKKLLSDWVASPVLTRRWTSP